MYTTNEQQIASAEAFIKGLPDSIVKGNYERWLTAVKLKGGITSEQLEKFLSYANSLPKGFQNYPQEFAISVKNKLTPESAKTASNKSATQVETKQPEVVREGAKLNPEKEETKVAKPTVVIKGGKK